MRQIRHRTPFLAAGLLAFVLSACGGGGGGFTADDTSSADPTDVLGQTDRGPLPPLPDVADTSSPPGPDVAVKEVFAWADIAAEEGGIGWPCDSNADCQSGYCIASADGQVCTTGCVENCPQGWICRQATFAVDLRYVCIPRFVHLCDPCARTEDCTGGIDGIDDRCLDYGDAGEFCGGDCSATGLCPTGYACETIEGDVRQCRPLDGECNCSPRATFLELETACRVTNDAGTCEGSRGCGPAGLSDCDAPVPEVEICDGRDNDCSGVADDFLEPPVCYNANQHGACPGEERCIDAVSLCQGPEPEPEVCDGFDNNCNEVVDEGYADSDADGFKDCIDTDDDDDDVPDEVDICPTDYDPDQDNYDGDAWGDACDDDDDNDLVNDGDDCAPLDATIHPGRAEACDFRDNDCDGETDEGICEDGNPCTDDLCDPVEGCSHQPNARACDDGNVCTINDTCVDGQCSPGGPMNCDDMNPCTDDFCNPSTGCYSVNSNRVCEDGNFCTEPDTCANGACNSGPWKSCDDGNRCTVDSCQPASGCVYDPNQLTGTPCDDGDPCFLGDTCGGGACTSGPISYCAQQLSCPQGIFLGLCLPIGSIPACIGGCTGK